MQHYHSVQALLDAATKKGQSISEIVLKDQVIQMALPQEDLLAMMQNQLTVMKQAAEKGLSTSALSNSGLSGGDAVKMKTAVDQKTTVGGDILGKILATALAISEVNASMGRIVAAPTAGSCGIIPAVLLTFQETLNLTDHAVTMSLFTASGIGMVIANNASISGAEGGCQAECGSAAAMAAAAAVELAGGSPEQCAHACAFALKSSLGLVCDPVAGLVEVPCVKRNASGAATALVAAEMALAGIKSLIPVDEVILAMKSVGDAIPTSLKETAEGGLAITPTAQKLAREIFR